MVQAFERWNSRFLFEASFSNEFKYFCKSLGSTERVIQKEDDKNQSVLQEQEL